MLKLPQTNEAVRKTTAHLLQSDGSVRAIPLEYRVRVLTSEEYDDALFGRDLTKREFVDEVFVDFVTEFEGDNGEPLTKDEARRRGLSNFRIVDAIFADYTQEVMSDEGRRKNSKRRSGR